MKKKIAALLAGVLGVSSIPAQAEPMWYTVSSNMDERWFVDLGAPSQFIDDIRTYDLLITKTAWAEAGAHHMTAKIQRDCGKQTYRILEGDFVDPAGRAIKHDPGTGWTTLADAQHGVKKVFEVICPSPGNSALHVKDVKGELDHWYDLFGKK